MWLPFDEGVRLALPNGRGTIGATGPKLERQGIKGQVRAIETHHQVGKEVREAIKRIGGTMPENLPPA